MSTVLNRSARYVDGVSERTQESTSFLSDASNVGVSESAATS